MIDIEADEDNDDEGYHSAVTRKKKSNTISKRNTTEEADAEDVNMDNDVDENGNLTGFIIDDESVQFSDSENEDNPAIQTKAKDADSSPFQETDMIISDGEIADDAVDCQSESFDPPVSRYRLYSLSPSENYL